MRKLFIFFVIILCMSMNIVLFSSIILATTVILLLITNDNEIRELVEMDSISGENINKYIINIIMYFFIYSAFIIAIYKILNNIN